MVNSIEGKGSVRSINEMVKFAKKLKEMYETSGTNKWFVPGTNLSLDRYKKHRAFFAAGATYPERLFMAGNRTGKSVSGSVESAMHATGIYEPWWPGRRFDHPTKGWACGDTSQTVRDTVQKELLGPPGALGTGTIPRDKIIKVYKKQGTSNGIEMAEIAHVSGGVSLIGFKSYEQGRKAFQGTAQDWIWLDEECPEDIYSECLIRTMTTEGIVYVTFTPLSGVTPFIVNFMKNADLLEGARPIMSYDGDEGDETANPFELPKQHNSLGTLDMLREAVETLNVSHGRAVVQAGWADAPHLDEATRTRMAANCPPQLLEARMHGYPSIGSGNVYPVPLEEILVDPFPIPAHWKHMYALDVGWNKTAVLWAAQNPEDNKIYLYSEHYQGESRPEVHAAAIKLRGDWIRGVVDPAARQRSQKDGEKLIAIYRSLGLKIIPAHNEVESGIYNVWGGLSGGTIKVFKTLTNFQKEYVVYARDDKGKIIKHNDHLMDTMRYIANNIHVAMQQPQNRRNRGERNGSGRKYDL